MTRLVLIESAVNVVCLDWISLIKSVANNRKRDDVHQEYWLKISRKPAFGWRSCKSVFSVRSGNMLAILETWMLKRWVFGLLIRLFASSKGARESALIGSESKPCKVARYPAVKQTVIKQR